MKKILEVLLYNDLQIDDELGNSAYSKENRRLLHEIIEKRECLETELNDKQKDLLEDLVDSMNQETAHFGDHRFERGFELGVLLMAEVFQDRETFWV
ncbi:MAG: hypothetical protein IJ716_14060 [Lachnospiraceae bacterium]|nr:hypothetical protein [Lachnospiraceae bacterium]